MSNLSMLTDLYEFSMANGYRQTITDEQGVFDVFFRKVPDNGSFVTVSYTHLTLPTICSV